MPPTEQQEQGQGQEHDEEQEQGNNTPPSSSSNSASVKRMPKSRRKRAKGEELNILKSHFELNPNPSNEERKKISNLVGMPEKLSLIHI